MAFYTINLFTTVFETKKINLIDTDYEHEGNETQ